MKNIATFSIVARDPITGELGIAVQSKFLAVGSCVPWAKADVGAIATQALANLDFGKFGLEMLEKGASAQETLVYLKSTDPDIEERQFGIVDANGGSATFTGNKCFAYAGGISEENLACQGNILVSEETVKALAATFKSSEGTLARRLILALDAALNAGGDRRGRQSASLLVVKKKGSYGGYNDRYIDLRVDDDPEPIKKLSDLLDLYEMYFNKTKVEDQLELDRELIEKVQTALLLLGYYQGEITGIYDDNTKNAYLAFCGWENFEERINEGNIVDCNVIKFLLEKSSK